MVVDLLVDDVDAVVARLARLRARPGCRRAPTRSPTERPKWSRRGHVIGGSSAMRNTNCSIVVHLKHEPLAVDGQHRAARAEAEHVAVEVGEQLARAPRRAASGGRLIATWLKRGLRDANVGSGFVLMTALPRYAGTIIDLRREVAGVQPDRGVEQPVERDVVRLDEQVVRERAATRAARARGRSRRRRSTNAPVITSSFSRMRFGSNRGARDARADEHERPGALQLREAPPPSPRRCPSTRARRRTARRRGRAAIAGVTQLVGLDACARRAARTASRRAVVRLAHDDVVDAARARSAATDERTPIGPPPVTSQRAARPCTAGPGDAVQRDRERLGERGVLAATGRRGGAAARAAGTRLVAGRTRPASRRSSAPTAAALDAQRRPAGEAVLALAAAWRRPADDRVADLPARRPRRRPRRPCR